MKFKTGDRVKITFGQPYWVGGVDRATGMDKLTVRDIAPELVGLQATIVKGTITQGQEKYALFIDGIGYRSWFQLKQLEAVKKTRPRKPTIGPAPGLRKYLYPLRPEQCYQKK